MATDRQIAVARAAAKEAFAAHLKAYPDKIDEATDAAWNAGLDAAQSVLYEADDEARDKIGSDLMGPA